MESEVLAILWMAIQTKATLVSRKPFLPFEGPWKLFFSNFLMINSQAGLQTWLHLLIFDFSDNYPIFWKHQPLDL